MQWLKHLTAYLKFPYSRLAFDAFSYFDLGKVPKSEFLHLKFLQLQTNSALRLCWIKGSAVILSKSWKDSTKKIAVQSTCIKLSTYRNFWGEISIIFAYLHFAFSKKYKTWKYFTTIFTNVWKSGYWFSVEELELFTSLVKLNFWCNGAKLC